MTNTIVDSKIQDLKDDVGEVKRKVENLDKKTWLILLFLALAFGEKFVDTPSIVGNVLAWGK